MGPFTSEKVETTPKPMSLRMTQPTTRAASVDFVAHQEIRATVIKACPKCQAPGMYKEESPQFDKWPGTCVKADSPLLGQPVGEFCPNCGAHRDPKVLEVDKGVIWEKWTYPLSWGGFKLMLKNKFRSLSK